MFVNTQVRGKLPPLQQLPLLWTAWVGSSACPDTSNKRTLHTSSLVSLRLPRGQRLLGNTGGSVLLPPSPPAYLKVVLYPSCCTRTSVPLESPMPPRRPILLEVCCGGVPGAWQRFHIDNSGWVRNQFLSVGLYNNKKRQQTSTPSQHALFILPKESYVDDLNRIPQIKKRQIMLFSIKTSLFWIHGCFI